MDCKYALVTGYNRGKYREGDRNNKKQMEIRDY